MDCQGGTFTIDVDVTDLGDATSISIADDGGVVYANQTATGIYLLGPYALGSAVNVTVIHDQNNLCTITYPFTFDCTPMSFCGTYTATPNVPIPDLGNVTSVINTGTNPGALIDLDVVVDIDHTFLGDLIITLQSPDGVTGTLMGRICGTNANMEIRFNDEASGPVACTEPTVGTFQPTGTTPAATPLSIFDGGTFDGNWTLMVSDNAGIDVGTLNSWCLIPTW